MVARIRAACEARRDPDLVVIARTDPRAVPGLDEAIRRAEAYRAAGADVLFVEAPVGEGEVATALGREGTTRSVADRMVSFEERFEIVGFSRYRELEERYRTP